jgi:hypothetical protein
VGHQIEALGQQGSQHSRQDVSQRPLLCITDWRDGLDVDARVKKAWTVDRRVPT